jgi:protein phosphatase PTC7
MQLRLILAFPAFLPNAMGFVNQYGRLPSNPTVSVNRPPDNGRSTTRLFDAPEPLAEEGSWQAFLDEETTGLIYYFDVKTGESLWEPPTATFPEVRLPRKKQRLADSLRRDYRRKRQQEIYGDVDAGQDGSTTTLVDVEEEIEEVDDVGETQQEVVEQTPEGPSWIEGIFDGGSSDAGAKEKKVAKDSTAGAASVKVEDEEPKRDWFGFLDEGKKTQPEVEEEDEAPPPPQKDWFSGFFSSSSTTVEEEKATGTDVAPEQDKGKKFGLFDSFATTFAKPERVEPETVVTPEKVEKKAPVPKKMEEKIVDLTPQPIKIEIGSHILPHPAKMRWGGEDAVFVKGRTFGVFDGVSGAEKMDGVPLYSRTLANEMKKMVGDDGCSIQQMTTYLTNAAAYADGAATGASTAVVASIGENGFLQALNIGDSYCMVVRNGKVTAKTREISHYWECPYQLSDDSPDRPRDGTKLNVELMNGDVILMGSDGVFDNVNDDMLLELVEKSPKKATVIAKRICDLSRKQSTDKNSVTPYAKQAQRRGDPDYRDGLGGKIDDVSCVVVVCK